MAQLERETEKEGFWNDSTAAQRTMKAVSALREEVRSWGSFRDHVRDMKELAALDDESLRTELEPEISALEADLEKRAFTAMLSEPYDRDDALLAIHAGAGGTDSQDWAAMLERMYLRWAEKRGYETEVLDRTEGEEAGLKSVTIAVDGLYTFGYSARKKACTASSGSPRSMPRTAGTPPLPSWKCCRRLPWTMPRWRSTPRT